MIVIAYPKKNRLILIYWVNQNEVIPQEAILKPL